jgi:hypothetical protein
VTDRQGHAPGQEKLRNARRIDHTRGRTRGGGTGAGLYRFGETQPNSEVRDDRTHGVLKFTLEAQGYTWAFVPVPGGSFTDSGSGTCH